MLAAGSREEGDGFGQRELLGKGDSSMDMECRRSCVERGSGAGALHLGQSPGGILGGVSTCRASILEEWSNWESSGMMGWGGQRAQPVGDGGSV